MSRLDRRLRDAEGRLTDPYAAEAHAKEQAWGQLTEDERDALLRVEAKCEALGPDLRPTTFVAAITEEEAEAWLRFADAWEEKVDLDEVDRVHNERYRKAMLRDPQQYKRYIEAGRRVDRFIATSRARGDRLRKSSEDEKQARRHYEAEEVMLLQGYYPGQCCEECGWGHPDVDPNEPCERCGGAVSYYGYYHLHLEPLDQLRRNVEAIERDRHPEYYARMQSYLDQRVARRKHGEGQS